MTDQSTGAFIEATTIRATDIRPRQGQGYWGRVGRRFLKDRFSLTAGVFLLAIIVLAVFAPVFATYDPYQGSALLRLAPVGTAGHWLGTDEVGRDIWSRMVYGGRLSLLVGVLPVFFALVIGATLGMLAGYMRGAVNTLIMRATDVLFAFPSILLAVAIAGILGAGIQNTLIALTASFVPPIIRITESVTAQVRHLDFVEAARASGAGPFLIIRHQIVPNVLGSVVVYATSLVSVSIILSSGLSFLGLGVSPPYAEWGLMLNNLRQAIWTQPLTAALPGVMIFATSMSFNLLSDGLRRAMDVKL
jgi:peptide/nickel transport system permease protein